RRHTRSYGDWSSDVCSSDLGRGGFACFPRRQGSRLKLRKRGDRSPAVPWANILTNVAAKDVIAHGLAQILRNAAAQLDSQVRNALARVHHVWLHKRLCGTCFDAAHAAPA